MLVFQSYRRWGVGEGWVGGISPEKKIYHAVGTSSNIFCHLDKIDAYFMKFTALFYSEIYVHYSQASYLQRSRQAFNPWRFSSESIKDMWLNHRLASCTLYCIGMCASLTLWLLQFGRWALKCTIRERVTQEKRKKKQVFEWLFAQQQRLGVTHWDLFLVLFPCATHCLRAWQRELQQVELRNLVTANNC